MNQQIIRENENKRLDISVWKLVFFAMFVFWQMGFIYFVGPSLAINDKTPLPINMDNATSLIAVCYILSIIWMIFLPKTVVWAQRISVCVAIVAALGLFLPLSVDVLRLLIYVQIFTCCFIIGFETFIVVNYFSEKSGIIYLTVAYGISELLIAFLQNEFHPVPFSSFRFIMVAALALLLVFFFSMPVGKEVQPHYVKKKDGLIAPRQLMIGAYVLVFIAALMGVSGPAIAGGVKNGVSIAYGVAAVVCISVYFLYKKWNFHPFRVVPALVGLCGIGYLLMSASDNVEWLSYVACGLIGVGMVPCQMLPLYGLVMMKSYPSKYISPTIIGLALVAVLVQGGMVEVFRSNPAMLNLVYAVIMAVLVFVYMQIEPFFLFTLRRRITDESAKETTEVAVETASGSLATNGTPGKVSAAVGTGVENIAINGTASGIPAKVGTEVENTATNGTPDKVSATVGTMGGNTAISTKKETEENVSAVSFAQEKQSTSAISLETTSKNTAVNLSEEDTEKKRNNNDPLLALTKKEREVAELICLGYTNKDIAKVLFISEHTVKDHTKKIYPKLGVHSRLELANLVNKSRFEKNNGD